MTREQCDLLSAPLVRTVNDMEDEILRVIAAQLAKDGNISDTSKWRIRQLARSGEMDKETAKIIARYSGLEENFAMAAIEDAAKIEMGYVDNAVRAEGLAALAMGSEASAEASAMGAYTAFQRQAKSSLNLVNTVMMYKAKQTFVNGVNKIYYESEKSRQDALNTMGKYSAGTVMGQFSLQEATRRCIREMAAKGIPAFVDKRGREWSPEAYVMMDMRSTLGNTARAAQWARCDEYGIKLVEVSSHLGARPGCAPYQGRIFSRDGSSGVTTDGAGNKITYTPLSQTSYGKPDGLFGINCGHVQYPFFPGCSFQSYFPYPKEENAEMYKNHQKQRYYERQIRAAKRECVMLNETGDTEGFKAAAARLKRSKESYKKFTESKGLYLHNDRTQVVGFDRSVSGKATWANRKAEQAKASAAAVKAGGVPSGGKGSSGSHAVTVTPPKDPAVGNSKKIYRDTNSGLTSEQEHDILKSSGTGRYERKEHTFEYLHSIDTTDREAITRELNDFQSKYENSSIEHCRVITISGDVYEVHGDKYTVNTSLLGDKMDGSINIHNHVKGESQYSFSWDDFESSIKEKSAISYAFDEKYNYRMSGYRGIDPKMAYDAYQNADDAILDRSYKYRNVPAEDWQHLTIEEACKLLNIKYWRERR